MTNIGGGSKNSGWSSAVIPPAPPVASTVPEAVQQPQNVGWSGLRGAFLIGGRTAIQSSTSKAADSSYKVDIDTNSTDWSTTYLFHLGGLIWAGPSFGYGITNRSEDDGTDTFDSRRTTLEPGAQIRAVLPSGKDQYIALGGLLTYYAVSGKDSYRISGESSSSTLSGSGLGYGGLIAFGQRLGAERAYLLETNIGLGGGGYDYTITSGGSTFNGNVSGTVVRFGISIGVAP